MWHTTIPQIKESISILSSNGFSSLDDYVEISIFFYRYNERLSQGRRKGGARGAGVPPIFADGGQSPPNI